MQTNKHEITEEYKKQLEQELDNLNNVLIPANVQALQEARSQGDLSENADYDAARDEQARLNGRLQEIKEILKTAVIIKLDNSDKVQNGKYVVLSYEGPKGLVEEKYQIVGSVEADIDAKKLSNASPFGKAVLGHKKGDTVKVIAPRGTISVTIKEVSNN
ncbi:MAG: transcription elongation factor GreA [Acholeplasmatales bacterium]|jgi:transcription elongation factor GreA|nr:transcription elongation factor GreA [Acholeplasmatales bacterium]